MRPRALLRYVAQLGWSSLDVPADGPASPTPAPSSTGLAGLHETILGCTDCRLAESRKKAVPGEGPDRPALMLIGEAPGAEENTTGRPFVGQAGKLLEAMLRAIGLDRQQVFITNVVKCRPPGNRNPSEAEMGACGEYLDRQIDLLAPGLILCLGRVPAQRLLATSKSMRALRGRWYSYRGVPVLATYHPAYLLRKPIDKRAAWEDLKLVVARLRADG